MTFKDAYYYPTYLGGKGDYTRLFEGQYYVKHLPGLKLFYMINTGYHLGQTFKHFYVDRTNDFLEMLLHHLVTLYLLFGSYMINIWECGAIIAYVHDLSDILGHLTKCLG